MIVTRPMGWSENAVVDDTMAALTTLDWSSPRPPAALVYFLVDDVNPYQRLLYSGLAAQNIAAVPAFHPPMADRVLQLLPKDLPIVVHLHWLYLVLKRAADEAEATQLIDAYLTRLRNWQERGARIIWTIHDVLAPEPRFPELEGELRQRVVDAVDLVHVMSPRNLEVVAEHYRVPDEKAYVLPHPTYAGAYPSWASGPSARTMLGIPRAAHVLSTIGQIRPYKGHQAFLEAFDEALETDPDLFWIVAGKLLPSADTEAFLERAVAHPRILLHAGPLPDAQLQFALRATDVMALPYRWSLNSGVVFLSLTFGLPVLASQATGSIEFVPPSARSLFDPDDHASLVRAILGSRRLADAAAVRDLAVAADELAPSRVGGAFAADVRTWIDGGPRPTSWATPTLSVG